jgi:predicted O-methyltransferase YrrM
VVKATPILPRLVRLYEERGIAISTGLDPAHVDGLPAASFTWFIADGKSLTNGLGIAMQEVYFLECLFAALRPRHLLIIGNSYGWSSLAIALLNEAAETVAIDAGFDRNALAGIDFTNRVATEEGLPLRVVNALSPRDLERVARDCFRGPIDFVFVDGYHSVEQVQQDFAGLRPLAAADCVYLFHDVHAFGLEPGIAANAAASGLAWELLLGTNSGMAVMAPPVLLAELRPALAPFIARPETIGLLRREAWNRRHPLLSRWRRSLDKRVARLRAR